MNIIFLDMDGVLCTDRTSTAYDEVGVMSTIDPVGCLFIVRLIEEFDCKIVISSTWRKEGLQFMDSVFKAAGFPQISKAFHKDWKTIIRFSEGFRGSEIETWIFDQEEKLETIDNYVIFDDLDQFHEYQKNDHLVQTDSRNGILLDDYYRAKEILNTIT